MNIPQIILTVLTVVVFAVIGFFIFTVRDADKRADKFDTVGTTMYWHKSKVPFIGRIVIQYTKKGKPYQTASNFMLKPKKLKQGAKSRWTIYTYHFDGKPPMTKAKRYKAPK